MSKYGKRLYTHIMKLLDEVSHQKVKLGENMILKNH